MTCNICGAELETGEVVCRICGNAVKADTDNKYDAEKRIEIPEARKAVNEAAIADTSVRTGDESVVVHPAGETYNKFCTRCGRILDINTHRCPVCDERERELFRIREENMRQASIRAKRAEEIRTEKQIKANVTIAVIMTLVAVFIITAFVFFKLLGGGEGTEDAVITDEAQTTEVVEVTEVPIIDDGNGEVHWKPTNE